MRKSIISSIAVLACATAFSVGAFAQEPQTSTQPAPAKAKVPAPPHDPHDLQGVWLAGGGGGGQRQEGLAPAAVRTEWMKAPLPLTPDGVVAINGHKGGKGPRGVAPSKANDPIGDANPGGLVRTLVYGRPIQFIQLPTEVVNMFEWYHMWRQIWTDGRKLPDEPDTLWYGTSVGKWDGDTFTVETVGLDPRSWLDEWGAPFTENMKLTERWHRTDRDNMQLTITVDDPKFYTKAWTSDPKTFRFQRPGTPDGELEEVIFAPWDEQEFNRRIRDPNPIITTGYQGNPTQK
jgi:hypothetical protein